MHPTYPTKCAYVVPKSGRVLSPASVRAVNPPNSSGKLVRWFPLIHSDVSAVSPPSQGLTLVHFSAQRKHILCDTLGA